MSQPDQFFLSEHYTGLHIDTHTHTVHTPTHTTRTPPLHHTTNYCPLHTHNHGPVTPTATAVVLGPNTCDQPAHTQAQMFPGLVVAEFTKKYHCETIQNLPQFSSVKQSGQL